MLVLGDTIGMWVFVRSLENSDLWISLKGVSCSPSLRCLIWMEYVWVCMFFKYRRKIIGEIQCPLSVLDIAQQNSDGLMCLLVHTERYGPCSIEEFAINSSDDYLLNNREEC